MSNTTKKEILVNNKKQDFEFRVIPLEEIGNLFLNHFSLGDFLDKNNYVPKITRWCCPTGYHNGISYEDMIKLYEASVELNPALQYEEVSSRIDFDFDFGSDELEPSQELERIEEINDQITSAKKAMEQMENSKIDYSFENILAKTDFKNLEERLNEMVIGQKEAINGILKPLINTKHRGFPKKEIISLYLLGPSGVGKTSSIEILAEELLKVPLLYLQGSEYGEEHTDRKLFGAPPSYIGYDPKGGLLANFIKNNPSSIILFDEIDKVHPRIYETLTSFLGDGFVTTPKGERYNFKGYLFFTSNTGNKQSGESGRDIGFGKDLGISESEIEKKRILFILRNQGISETFLGRIGSFVRFNTLDDPVLSEILNKYSNEANEKLKYYKMEVSDAAKEKIIHLGEPSKWGARNIYHNFDKVTTSELSYEFEMKKDIEEGSHISIDYKDPEFIYSIEDNVFLRKNINSFGS